MNETMPYVFAKSYLVDQFRQIECSLVKLFRQKECSLVKLFRQIKHSMVERLRQIKRGTLNFFNWHFLSILCKTILCAKMRALHS